MLLLQFVHFARAMKEFAVSHNLTFKPQDMEKLDLEQGDFEFMSQVNTVQESNMHGTSKTSYNIIKDFRNIVSAGFWQLTARVFGHNLRSIYNPKKGEDRMIEYIINIIENNNNR